MRPRPMLSSSLASSAGDCIVSQAWIIASRPMHATNQSSPWPYGSPRSAARVHSSMCWSAALNTAASAVASFAIARPKWRW